VADRTEARRLYLAHLVERAEERVRASEERMVAAARLLDRARETARRFDELHPPASPERD
jgi:hypothetical protein